MYLFLLLNPNNTGTKLGFKILFTRTSSEIGEKFTIKVSKNKIIVKNDINNKLEIKIKFTKFKKEHELNKLTTLKGKKYYFDNLINKDLINELLNLTKNIGSYIFGKGAVTRSLRRCPPSVGGRNSGI